MTYQEVNDRLTRVQTALQSLQDGSYANSPSINVPQMTSQLQEVEAKLQEQLLVLSEAEKTAFVNGQATEYTDEKELQKLKDNQDVKSIKTAGGKTIKEADGVQFTKDETKAIAREVGKAVAKGLKSMGDELASMKATNIEEGSFDINVQYKKDTSTDDFSFHIVGEELHLTDFSFDKVIGSVGVKPSGEPIVHVDVIANELVKHWSSQMKEGMSDEEWADAEQNQRLEDHPEKDMIKKIQSLIAKEKGLKKADEMKNPGYASSSQSNQYSGRSKGAKLSHSQKEKNKEDRAAWIKGLKDKGMLDEAPYQTTYIKVAKSDYKKAMSILDDVVDNEYVKTDIVDDDGAGNVIIYFNFTTAMTGHPHYNPDVDPAEFIYDLAMDLRANDIPVAQASHDIDENTDETPEGGMDQGGDLDVGHQDDEPNMLKKDLYDIATYAAKLYKQLDKYDKQDGEVDFPHWWQKKVTLAREYISSAQHYLEAEEKQPALDQLALERVVKDNESPSLKAKIAAEDFMSQYRKAFRLVSNNFGKEAEAEFKSIIKAKFAQLQESSLDEIGMFNDPVGYEKSKPEKPTYTKKYVSKNVYDIFKHGKKVKTVKGSEGEANAWMNNAKKGQQNEEVGGQSISDLKPGDKFEFNGKTFTLVKHIEGNIAKVIRPNGDTSTVSFGGKINTGKKAGIGPDAFGQGKGHHIDENLAELGELLAAFGVLATAGYTALQAVKILGKNGDINTASLKAAYDKFTSKDKSKQPPPVPAAKIIQPPPMPGEKVNEAQSTCCGKCGRKHVKGTKCKTPYLKGKDHCRTR